MANIWEKAISILVGDLNLDRSYFIAAVLLIERNFILLCLHIAISAVCTIKQNISEITKLPVTVNWDD